MSKISQMPSKKIFFTLLILIISELCIAQNPNAKSTFWNHVRFGGGVGIGFANGDFNASISPSAIYQFNDQFSAGVGLNFNYAKFRDNKFLAYGGSVLSLYNPLPFIQLSGEFEQLRINQSRNFGILNAGEDNYWSPALYLGAGYTQQNITIGIRYDALYDEDTSIYATAWLPFVRVYF